MDKQFNTNESKTCEICNISTIDKEGVFLNDWIWFDLPQCKTCNAIICRACLKTCFECYSKFGVYCKNCIGNLVMQHNCEYHYWEACEKHITNECGQCIVNRNYDLKHCY